MKRNPAVLAIDQGTTSSRAMVFDLQWNLIASSQREFEQLFPQPGWVEHRPEDIWETTLHTAREAIAMASDKGFDIQSIGITNQRETTLVWDRATGKPVYNAIVWQDRRTADHCQQLKQKGTEAWVQTRTGLLVDPYFSATKISWILDNIPSARASAENGELAFGTVDSYLIYQLTGGKKHLTDATNASRTNLFNIHSGEWDDELLQLFRIPRAMLPEVNDCVDDFGTCDPVLFGRAIPIQGVAGDQQAAAIGQCCFQSGSIKSTYGTGCFVLLNTGDQAVLSQHRLLTTVAYRIDGQITYALEGSIFVAGSAVQWLRDGLGIIQSASETEPLAAQLSSNDGVYLVPAFTGLGAPWWDPEARGALSGLTRATSVAHIVRATLESMAYQTRDLLEAMKLDGVEPTELRVDGGMVANQWLLQFLADVLAIPIHRPRILETTALGAANLAAIGAGLVRGFDELEASDSIESSYRPRMDTETRQGLLEGWQNAVHRVLEGIRSQD